MVETTYAKIFARYGYWSNNYLGMLRGAPIPKHVIAMAEAFERSRPWEKPDEPKKPTGWGWLDTKSAVVAAAKAAAIAATAKPEPEGEAFWASIMAKAAVVQGAPIEAKAADETDDSWWASIEAKAKEIEGK